MVLPSSLINLIKSFEGLRLQAYRSSFDVWTIGYGHTGSDVHEGMTISEQQANEFLIQDLLNCLSQAFKASPVLISSGENRISAIGDFVFNLGIGRYQDSTLRKRVDEEDWESAAFEIHKWVFAEGKKLKGLIARREVEAKLLLKG